MNDLMRKLIEMAVSAGRSRQSAQTGFVHLCYQPHEDEADLTIPLLENSHFALALFRSRTVENVEEAKELLNKLLNFQSADGNFPVYLHEYPVCRDRYLGVHLLIPFYWIAAHYQHILGNELRRKFEEALKRLIEYALKWDVEAPPLIAIKVAAATQAFGKLWQDEKLLTRGRERLASLQIAEFKTPQQLSSILPSLQLVEMSNEKIWDPFWNWLEETWHRKLLAYVGPGWSEWQEESEPQATLYDLYMGYLSGSFSARALQNQLVHLQGALIHPIEKQLPSVIYPRKTLETYQEESFAYSMIFHQEEWPKVVDRSFHRFKLAWGLPQLLHTFVCQGGNIAACLFEPDSNKILMRATLGALPQEGEREKCRELAFYLNLEAAESILIDGVPATTFAVGDEIVIKSDLILITLSFQLLSGTGDFVGHIMRGNRPSQLALKANNRYEAYDWQIFLRTLRRSDECQFKVNIEIKNK